MKTRYKLFLVYLAALALLLLILSLTYHRWFEAQKQTIFEANAQVAKSIAKTIVGSSGHDPNTDSPAEVSVQEENSRAENEG